MLQIKAVEDNTLELLRDLMSQSYLEDFQLVGGTALALQIGHRLSVDLDLFTLKNFSVDHVWSRLMASYSEIELIAKDDNTLICNIANIKTDFIKFNYLLEKPDSIDGIRLSKTQDIAAMKLDAITGRGKKKDFYDLFFLLDKFSLKEMLDFYSHKYHHSTIFHLIRSLTWFEDAEFDVDPLVFDRNITWQKIKSSLTNEVKRL